MKKVITASFNCFTGLSIRARMQIYKSIVVNSTVGMSDTLAGIVDASGLLCLRVGVSLLTVDGGA